MFDREKTLETLLETKRALAELIHKVEGGAPTADLESLATAPWRDGMGAVDLERDSARVLAQVRAIIGNIHEAMSFGVEVAQIVQAHGLPLDDARVVLRARSRREQLNFVPTADAPLLHGRTRP